VTVFVTLFSFIAYLFNSLTKLYRYAIIPLWKPRQPARSWGEQRKPSRANREGFRLEGNVHLTLPQQRVIAETGLVPEVVLPCGCARPEAASGRVRCHDGTLIMPHGQVVREGDDTAPGHKATLFPGQIERGSASRSAAGSVRPGLASSPRRGLPSAGAAGGYVSFGGAR
jgi:hypothetical protein